MMDKNKWPSVAIIVLNWNGWQDTIECLESLYQISYPNYEIIVVDNGSKDESIENIKKYCEGKIKVKSKFFEYSNDNKQINIIEYTREQAGTIEYKKNKISNFPSNKKLTLIKNEKNFGFAEGNNIAIRYALKALNINYILLLNNDTIVEKKFLDELVKTGKNNEKVGIIGPKIYYYDYNGKKDVIWFAGGKINWWTGVAIHIGDGEKDYGQYNINFEPEYLTGCVMLIKREALEECGMFDSKFFLYYEDADLCFNMKKQGWKLKYIPTARIWHKVGQSSRANLNSHLGVYFITRNRILFIRKHYTKLQYLIFLSIFLTYKNILKCIQLMIIVKNFKALKCFYRGMWNGIRNT